MVAIFGENVNDALKASSRFYGRLGGLKTLKKYGRDHFKKLNKLSHVAKRKKKKDNI